MPAVNREPQTIENTWDEPVFRETLASASAAVGVSLTEHQLGQCLTYTRLLLETNAHTNLTRITAPADIAIKHFADSLSALDVFPDDATTAADVGTGAGFPGIVLKIARPELCLTLIDSLQKRLTFLEGVTNALGWDDVRFLHARAEEAGQVRGHRGHYSVVIARAVAALPTLLEWCGPLVKTGGQFIAMKSGGAEEEIAAATNAANVLKLQRIRDQALTLPAIPGSEESPAERRLVVYQKVAATPPQFPRSSAEIKRRPL